MKLSGGQRVLSSDEATAPLINTFTSNKTKQNSAAKFGPVDFCGPTLSAAPHPHHLPTRVRSSPQLFLLVSVSLTTRQRRSAKPPQSASLHARMLQRFYLKPACGRCQGRAAVCRALRPSRKTPNAASAFHIPTPFYSRNVSWLWTCDSGTLKISDTPSQQKCWTRVRRNATFDLASDLTFLPFTVSSYFPSRVLESIFGCIVFKTDWVSFFSCLWSQIRGRDLNGSCKSCAFHCFLVEMSLPLKPSMLTSAILAIQLLFH